MQEWLERSEGIMCHAETTHPLTVVSMGNQLASSLTIRFAFCIQVEFVGLMA